MSIDLNYDYLDRVRRVASLYTKRKTSDLLDGDYSSMQHGRSLDFDDLREYRYGDDINYIDWKSSSRVGKPLVRRYFADRKHDVLFIGDTGKKMTGDTPAGESKEHIALMAFGVIHVRSLPPRRTPRELQEGDRVRHAKTEFL